MTTPAVFAVFGLSSGWLQLQARVWLLLCVRVYTA